MLPVIETARLRLCAFVEADIAALVPLIGDRRVAATTLRIPHPYRDEHARYFLEHMQDERQRNFAIRLRPGALIGGIGLRLEPEHAHAELGYWLGVPYWGRGYATEAAAAVLAFGFESLGLHRIYAEYFRHNPASGAVLRKLGMRHEGTRRQHVRKWDRWVDVELYALLRDEWRAGDVQ